MKKLLSLIILLILGLGLGGGAAYGVSRLLGPPPPPEQHAAEQVETSFVPAGTILAPIVAQDGGLSGYANFDVQLEVSAENADEVTARLPFLLHAVNLRAWKTPMASGPHYMLPDLRLFAKMVEDAAKESLGKDAVIRVVVTGARPV